MQKPTLSEKIGAVLFLALIAVIWILVETSGEEEKPIAEQPPAEETASADAQPEKPAEPKYTKEQLAEALKAIEAEPKVASAAWNNESIPSLLVGVADDGTTRDGYAESMCLILTQHRIYGGVVHVMDNYTDEWKELGTSWCPSEPPGGG